MSKNTWILWAVILMIPGAIGLGYHFAQKNALNTQISQAAEATAGNSATQEYLDMYQRWFQLPPEEKADNPWGQNSYGGPEIQKRLQEEQSDRLLADLADLDKGVRHFPEELAETLYGSEWKQAVEEYRHQRNRADVILIGTVFLMAGSGLLLIGGLGKLLFVYSLSRLKRTKDDSAEPQDAASIVSDTEEVPVFDQAGNRQGGLSDGTDQLGYFESRKKTAPKTSPASDTNKGSLTELSKSFPASLAVSDKPAKDSYFGWAIGEGEEESSNLETLMTTEPLTKELTELTEEVSAIRQFAAQQQDQVRKLQDGYDWMIIRRFCMRIIRSIDNVEDRITRLNDSDSDVAVCLEDIRDELIFALESSGIEQFNPELKTPFKGLEKYVEAVRQRIPTDEESLCGCIAEIVRPGYQYLISDDDVKIVRCAQVKLYDAK